MLAVVWVGVRGLGIESGVKPPEMVVHLDRPALETVLVHMIEKDRLDACAAEVKRRCALPVRGVAERRAAIENSLDWLKTSGVKLRSFNATDRAIQELFDTHILERRPVLAESGAATVGPAYEVAHFVLIGFGQVGQRLALYLAEQGHFENLRRSRMTIVYAQHEAEAVGRFREEHPALFPNLVIVREAQDHDDAFPRGYNPEDPDNVWMPHPRLDTWEFGVRVRDVGNPTDNDRGVGFVCNGGFAIHAGGVTSPDLVERLVRLSDEPTVRPMVFICDADDEDNCAQALQLRQELDLRLKDNRAIAMAETMPLRSFRSCRTVRC